MSKVFTKSSICPLPQYIVCFPRIHGKEPRPHSARQRGAYAARQNWGELQPLSLYVFRYFIASLLHGSLTVWSNFEIADLDLWRSESYTKFFDFLDSKGVRVVLPVSPMFLTYAASKFCRDFTTRCDSYSIPFCRQKSTSCNFPAVGRCSSSHLRGSTVLEKGPDRASALLLPSYIQIDSLSFGMRSTFSMTSVCAPHLSESCAVPLHAHPLSCQDTSIYRSSTARRAILMRAASASAIQIKILVRIFRFSNPAQIIRLDAIHRAPDFNGMSCLRQYEELFS